MSDPAYPPGVRPFRAGDEVPILAAMLAAHGRGEFEGVNRHWLEESVRRLAEEPEGARSPRRMGGSPAGSLRTTTS